MGEMEFLVDQELSVTDKSDGKRYPAKVLLVDKDQREVKIHFVGWHKKFDEVLSFDSTRIHLENDEEEQDDSFLSTQDVGSTGAAIGRLLMGVDAESKKIVSTYDLRLSKAENCKNINNKFKVPQLDACAEALSINIKGEDGKKIFIKNKAGLTEAIVLKIKSYLPRNCENCEQEYSIKLGETPLFVCCKCTLYSSFS